MLDLEPARTRPGRQRNLGLAAVAGVLAVALVVAVSVVLADGDNLEKDEPAAGGFGGELLGIGAENGRIQRRFPAGRTPAALAAGAGQLWLVDADARTILRLETSSGETETLATGATPADVAIGAGAVWIANGSPLSAAQFVGPVATEIVRLDTRTRTQRATVALPRVQGAVSNSA